MLEVAFRDLRESAIDIRNKQAFRYPFKMGASILVPNGNGLARATLVADETVDIEVMGLNATVVAPCDSYGRRLISQSSSFPMPGAATGYAERGIRLRWFAASEKEDQLSDPLTLVDAKNLFQPGYMPGRFKQAYPLHRYLKRSDKLTFELLNTDTATGEGGVFHFVTLVLSCRRYETFTK